MKDYGIPNDSLEQRMRAFVKLMTPDPLTGYVDGVGFQLLVPYAKGKTLNQRLLLGVYYSMSYSVTTAIRFFEEFPEITDWKKVEEYWSEEKDSLVFAPDRKYLKNNNQVIVVLKNIYRLSNGDLDGYFTPFLKSGFETAYREILNNWYGYGPMGAYLFFDTVCGCIPELYSDPAKLDWKNSGQTVVEGMAHLMGDDELIDTKNYPLDKYDEAVVQLTKLLKAPLVMLESVLCFYRKLFKATRYWGYYADRELEECLKVDKILQRYNVDVWKLREMSCFNKLRGEVNGWNGIQKFMLRDYLNTGQVRCSLESK